MRRDTEVLIVRQREDGVWGYFNPHDYQDNGTIVQFLQHRRGAGFTLGHVKNTLRGRVGRGSSGAGLPPVGRLGGIVPGLPRPVVHAPKDLSRVVARWRRAGPVRGLPPYLEGRGLAAATVAAYASALRLDDKGNVLFGHRGCKPKPQKIPSAQSRQKSLNRSAASSV